MFGILRNQYLSGEQAPATSSCFTPNVATPETLASQEINYAIIRTQTRFRSSRGFSPGNRSQRSGRTTADIHVVRWEGAPQAAPSVRRGWTAGASTRVRSITAAVGLHHSLTHRVIHGSDEQLPPSGPSCQQVNLLETVPQRPVRQQQQQ